MGTGTQSRMRVVVVGHGMVGHRLLQALVDLDALRAMHITVLAEERRAAYDRVALSSYFAGASADDLSLAAPGFFDEHGIELRLGDPVERVDRASGVVTSASGRATPFDHLVLATGSAPFVPPIEGADGEGCFVYRTLDDLDAIAAAARRPGVRRGAVVGGGLLGLEAANALRNLGLETHVVEFAPHLMPAQLCAGGGTVLRRHVERLGVRVHLERRTTAVVGVHGVERLEFEDHAALPVDLVVFSAGIRPRDQLARDCGLAIGPRGGVAVDATLRASDPRVSAIGECAAVDGVLYGLVAPGYQMARVVAARLAAAARDQAPRSDRFVPPDLSTELKLLGVQVASVGDARGGDGTTDVVWSDPTTGVFQKVVVDAARGTVAGAVLVGDASPYPRLVAALRSGEPVDDVAALLRGRPAAGDGSGGVAACDLVCSCEGVSAAAVGAAVAAGAADVTAVQGATRAGTGCGGCVPALTAVVRDALAARGVEVDDRLCEHFALSRIELFDLVRVRRHRSFAEVLAAYGRGLGCEVCRPTVASIVASLDNGHILDGEHAALQDTNDHFLANLQRNGTYSVVPRVPGGEITPERLIALGKVARDFDLYTKITGGQRIDLLGARLEQLPAIWRRLVDAGFESGHAYGKAVRTVKSCVGETWCRYGVADSTTMAIRIEERYRGLRAPHKLKFAVSGCIRECAEAQSKDIGVIATEHGWNLYVGGNGGARPRHADLFAEHLDDDTLVRLIDRLLVYYVRTADRLERTSTWLARLDGGLDRLRRVVIDDELGIAAELEAEMARHVATYECEWRATLDDPARLARFVTFVNAPEAPDPTVVFVRERDQIRPARAHERVLAEAVPAP